MSQAYAIENGRSKNYSAFNPHAIQVMHVNNEPSKTRQEFTEECDINFIMKNYDKAGFDPMGIKRVPMNYDFVGMPDLQGALNAMIEAEEAFMTLPAIVRKEFDNDPVRFVEFAQNGDNVPKLREWGLALPEELPSEPMRVRIVPDKDAPPIAPAPAAAKT